MPTLQDIEQEPPAIRDREEEEDDDDDIDETVIERLYGLREMFPEFMRNGASTLVSSSCNLAKFMYSSGRTGLWVIASSATILALPVLLEKEMIDLSDMQAAQQREMFLGPGMGAAGPGAMGMGGVPQPPLAQVPVPQPS